MTTQSALTGWDLVTALVTETDDDGFIGIQPDVHGEDPAMSPFELHHPYGFASRAADPDEDGVGCSMLKAYDGDDGHGWLADDPRYVSGLPELEKGGSVFYGGRTAAPTWLLTEGEDGSVQLYVPYALSAGVPTKAFTLRFDTTTQAITMLHSAGQTICLTKEQEIVLAVDDDTHLTIGPGQITAQCESFVVNGTLTVGNPIGAIVLPPGTPGPPRLLVNPL